MNRNCAEELAIHSCWSRDSGGADANPKCFFCVSGFADPVTPYLGGRGLHRVRLKESTPCREVCARVNARIRKPDQPLSILRTNMNLAVVSEADT